MPRSPGHGRGSLGDHIRAWPQAVADQSLAADPFAITCKNCARLPAFPATPIILNAKWLQRNGRWLAFPPGGKEAELHDIHRTLGPICSAVDLPVSACTAPSILLLSDPARTPALTPGSQIDLTPSTKVLLPSADPPSFGSAASPRFPHRSLIYEAARFPFNVTEEDASGSFCLQIFGFEGIWGSVPCEAHSSCWYWRAPLPSHTSFQPRVILPAESQEKAIRVAGYCGETLLLVLN